MILWRMLMNLGKMNKLINKLSDEPFEYGVNDCFTFTNALISVWHGSGHNYSVLHQYENKKEALKYLEVYGGIEKLTTGTLGYPRAPELSEDGDVITAEVAPGEIALGFVFKGFGLFMTEKRVIKLSLKKCSKGWRMS